MNVRAIVFTMVVLSRATAQISGDSTGFADSDVPTGLINGVNSTFVVSHAPTPPQSLQLYVNGLLMKAAADYTLQDRTISFTQPAVPRAGSLIQAYYRYAVTRSAPRVETSRSDTALPTPAALAEAAEASFEEFSRNETRAISSSTLGRGSVEAPSHAVTSLLKAVGDPGQQRSVRNPSRRRAQRSSDPAAPASIQLLDRQLNGTVSGSRTGYERGTRRGLVTEPPAIADDADSAALKRLKQRIGAASRRLVITSKRGSERGE